MSELSAHKQTSAKIRELYTAGKTKEEIQDELDVDRRTVNIALGYMLKKTREAMKAPTETPVVLYAERDAKMKDFYNSLNTKGALSKLHMHDMRINNHTGESA
jgi:orotate phosphoribosyltransferase-like protein